MEVFSAIRILEREGFLIYIESSGQYSKLFVLMGREELYRFMVENPKSERMVKEILRSYSGVFTDYVNINEAMLAKRADMTTEEVIKQLELLDRLKLISYIPIRKLPQLVYTVGRQRAEHIQLSDKNYRFLKEAAEKRLEALIHFITDNLKCRSQQLLAYFGEPKSRRCGICDVCIGHNKVNLNDIEFEQLVEQIKGLLLAKPRNLYELIPACSTFAEEQVIDVLRWLMDNNKVSRDKKELLFWHDQLNLAFE